MSTATAAKVIAGRKLGCVIPKVRPSALSLSSYMATAPANLPESVDYLIPAAMEGIRRMYLNDHYGDCVFADIAHKLDVLAANESGKPVLASDHEIEQVYLHLSPYDQGIPIATALDYWRDSGIMLGGKLRKVDGYVSVDWRNPDLLKVALLVFGNLQIGIKLPPKWHASADGDVWDFAPLGIKRYGHDIGGFRYDAKGVTIATWGGLRLMPWEVIASGRYVTECYAVLAPEWYEADGISATGLKVDDLKGDLAKIGSGDLPPISPAIDWSPYD